MKKLIANILFLLGSTCFMIGTLLNMTGCATVKCDDGYSSQVCEARSDRGIL
jgi:hypothetical protein